MSAPKRIHHRGFSFTSTLIFMADHCLASPLLFSRDQGTSVLSADTPDPTLATPPARTESTEILSGWKNSTAIVFFVAMASLALTIPMFVYIWMRRRKLHATRARARKQQQSKVGPMRKGSVASTVEVPLTAPAPVGRVRKESVTFAQPVRISVKPIRAVEIIVKPGRGAMFKDSTWEKL